MDVLVVRHAVALDRDEANAQGVADADRPLTRAGQRRMKGVARGLAHTVPNLSALYSSPWRRAVETADLLRARFRGLRNVESDALLPQAAPEALVELFARTPADALVAVVGHEPHLSTWVSWCLTGGQHPLLELRKGGACLLRFEDTAGPSRGKLRWHMTPSVLRQL